MNDKRSIECVGDLVGMTPLRVSASGEDMTLHFQEGVAQLYHQQDCCECVSIEDINGDLSDLEGVPLLVADERSDGRCLGDYGWETWTFYTFRTIKGSVDVRWCGSSNGYYSEGVDFEWTPGCEG